MLITIHELFTTYFRTLKYAVGMINLHSTKENSILQEIWSSFIMYNLSSRIASSIIIEKKDTKWSYKIDMALVIHICFNLFSAVLGNYVFLGNTAATFFVILLVSLTATYFGFMLILRSIPVAVKVDPVDEWSAK